MEITAAMVQALREKTGLPMMEVKKALQEAGGDEEKAVDILRKKGLTKAGQRSGNVTAQGKVVVHVDPASKRAAIVEVLCESEPVTGTAEFTDFAKAVARVAAEKNIATADELLSQPHPTQSGRKLKDAFEDMLNRIRENMKVGRIGVCQGETGHYVHHDSRKGVLIEFSGSCPDATKQDVCMHVVAVRPEYNRREEVDPAAVAKEREFARSELKDKPPQMIEKIIEGKINRWYGERVLLEQAFVKDEKQTVGQLLKGVAPGLTINRFVRVEIGES